MSLKGIRMGIRHTKEVLWEWASQTRDRSIRVANADERGISAFAIFMLFCTLGACNKSLQNNDGITLPAPVLFKVINNEKLSQISKADLFWYENGIKRSENDISIDLDIAPFRVYYPVGYDSTNMTYLVDSLNPLLYSASLVNIAGYHNQSGIFYISYGKSLVDTIAVTVSRVTYKSGYSYKLNEIKMGGIELQIDPNPLYAPHGVYILK